MLRDSCLYSSLACSVYSICWVFFFSHFKSQTGIYSSFDTNDNSHSDLFCWRFVCIFWIHKGRLIHGDWVCGRIYSLTVRDMFKAKLYVFGWVFIVCKSLNVTCSEWSCVGVDALFHNADTALTSSGLWFFYGRHIGIVCGFYSCLPRWSQVLHDNTDFFYCIFLIQLFDLCFDWQTMCYNIC